MARLLVASALLVLASVALHGGQTGGATSADAQEAVTVEIGDFFFCDAALPPGACQTVVGVGDTVVWDYSAGSEGHTVTHCGDSCDTPTDSPLFDSGGLRPGQTFSYTFSAPGIYLYYCRFHPAAMRAAVLVEAAPIATATEPLTASPAATPSLVTPTPGAEEEDDDGVSTWVLILGSFGAAVVILGAVALAVRRFR